MNWALDKCFEVLYLFVELYLVIVTGSQQQLLWSPLAMGLYYCVAFSYYCVVYIGYNII